MADLEKLYEAAPGLRRFSEPDVVAFWREFMNSYEQKDLMPLLMRPLEPFEIRLIQDRFSTWWLHVTEKMKEAKNATAQAD